MIIVDARVLIAHLDPRDASHHRAQDLLMESAAHRLAASAVTLAECLVGPARMGKLGPARAALQDLEIEEIPVPAGAAQRLAELRADTGLKPPDCCVLLAAQDVSADAILTLDDRLANRARERGYEWESEPAGDG